MKPTIFFLLTWFTTTANLSHLDEPVIKVTRTSAENQIKETERQVLQRYGVKAEVKVIDRNSRVYQPEVCTL